jgi:hypothetical protein
MCVPFISKRNLLQDNQTLTVTCKHIHKDVQEDAKNTDIAKNQLGLNK